MYTEGELSTAPTSTSRISAGLRSLRSWLTTLRYDLRHLLPIRLLPASLRPNPSPDPSPTPADLLLQEITRLHNSITTHEAQTTAHLSRIASLESTLQSSESALASLRVRFSQETSRAQEAMAHAAAATSLAVDWQSRYLQEVSSHILDIKSTSNWFAQTTSARTPMFDGAGPSQRPLPDGPDGLAGLPGGVGRTRASVAVRERTRKTLAELEDLNQQQFKEYVEQEDSQDAIPATVSDEQVKSLWTQIMGPDAPYPSPSPEAME